MRRVAGRPWHAGQDGVLSLEAVWILPLLVLLGSGLLLVVGVGRDVLVAHEAARAGARAAATSTGADAVHVAVRRAGPELEFDVRVEPLDRRDGDVVTVTVTTERQVGPLTHVIGAEAVARVEPVVAGRGAAVPRGGW